MKSEYANSCPGGGSLWADTFSQHCNIINFSIGFRLVQERRSSENAFSRPSTEVIVFNDFDVVREPLFRDFHLEHAFKALFVTF